MQYHVVEALMWTFRMFDVSEQYMIRPGDHSWAPRYDDAVKSESFLIFQMILVNLSTGLFLRV